MGFGEGGPEIVKQLLGRTYEIAYPEVIAVHLKGRPSPGVGPQDMALALIRAVSPQEPSRTRSSSSSDRAWRICRLIFRNGIDVMTTETTCLSSIWRTDGQVEAWYRTHGRPRPIASWSPPKWPTTMGSWRWIWTGSNR